MPYLSAKGIPGILREKRAAAMAFVIKSNGAGNDYIGIE